MIVRIRCIVRWIKYFSQNIFYQYFNLFFDVILNRNNNIVFQDILDLLNIAKNPLKINAIGINIEENTNFDEQKQSTSNEQTSDADNETIQVNDNWYKQTAANSSVNNIIGPLFCIIVFIIWIKSPQI